jgi:CRAL/TRIO, N-terminal domain
MSVDPDNLATLDEGLTTLNINEKVDRSPVTMDSTNNGDTTQSPAVVDKPTTRKLPFAEPVPSATIPTPPQLTADEQTKYDTVLEYLKSLPEFPTSSSKKSKKTAPLSDVEQYFLSRECILRYLRATKWVVADAKKRLEGTIIWRREYGTDTLLAETVEPEVLTT